eukprot:CAMPEP_0170501964 /NCGR_PEP_ID=MMETSP0208-20121228/40028_1 /TAXON_ID=197538 /ORGANISM="Strombidium inclinatum, Strain S3" /LENGTH=60 /DNA_ID=CAMNT_0010780783 /DNA_START=39 /DNA_END=218 /DNA_ORIENTATION=+
MLGLLASRRAGKPSLDVGALLNGLKRLLLDVEIGRSGEVTFLYGTQSNLGLELAHYVIAE